MRKVTFNSLRVAAEAEGNYGAQMALMSAETNAHETIHLEKEASPEDFDRLALDSICYTGPFTSDEKVADWFRDHGYCW